MSEWRQLGTRAGAGAGLAVAVVLVGWLAGFRIHLLEAILIGAFAGVGWWLLDSDRPPPTPRAWPVPELPGPASLFEADSGTRRVAALLHDAQPGREFSATGLQKLLLRLARERVRRRHGPAAVATRTELSRHLSRELAQFLALEEPRGVRRRALRTYLKEIDEL